MVLFLDCIFNWNSLFNNQFLMELGIKKSVFSFELQYLSRFFFSWLMWLREAPWS